MTKPLLLAMLLLAVSLTADDKLVGGPYVVNTSSRSATVMWLVETGHATIGTSPDQADKKAPVLRVEKVSFTGLKAGSKYYYDVLGRDEGRGSFMTAPASGTAATFQFVVYGDTRTRHDMHRKVVGAILQYAAPDFVLHTGDLVENGADSAQWPTFFGIEYELLRRAAFFPSLGNHERNDRQFFDFFNVANPYYSFNWGSSHFIVLNSDLGNAATSDTVRERFWEEQTRWLEEDLKGSQEADFRFVMAHHPPLTAVKRRQGDNPHMTALMPMFEKYRVTAGFFGHDHNYQHYLKENVHYFITGGGGAPLYDVDVPPQGITKKVVSTEHFLTVKVDGKTARVEAIGLDGRTIETTELKR